MFQDSRLPRHMAPLGWKRVPRRVRFTKRRSGRLGFICSSVVHHHCIAHTVLYTPAYMYQKHVRQQPMELAEPSHWPSKHIPTASVGERSACIHAGVATWS